MTTTKLDICSRVSKRINKPVVEIKPIFESILDEVLSILSEGERIELRGFGAFKVKERKKRIGRNPRTGQLVDIPSHKVPVFKFSRDGLKIFGEKLASPKKLPKNQEKAEEKPVDANATALLAQSF